MRSDYCASEGEFCIVDFRFPVFDFRFRNLAFEFRRLDFALRFSRRTNSPGHRMRPRPAWRVCERGLGLECRRCVSDPGFLLGVSLDADLIRPRSRFGLVCRRWVFEIGSSHLIFADAVLIRPRWRVGLVGWLSAVAFVLPARDASTFNSVPRIPRTAAGRAFSRRAANPELRASGPPMRWVLPHRPPPRP